MKVQRMLQWVSAALVVAVSATACVGQELEDLFRLPQPKGAGETLDTSPTAARPGDQAETIVTIQGDRIGGKVLDMEAGGNLRLTGPQFDGDVRILVSNVDQIVLRGQISDVGKDDVRLTNGDRIRGRIVTVDEEAVFVETRGAGRMKISRKIVQAMGFDKGSPMLLESDFASGQMDPWTPRGGQWTVSNGILMSNHHGNNFPLVARLDQREAVTLVAKLPPTNNLSCEISLFVDTPQGTYGRNSVIAMFRGSEYYLMYTQNGSTNSIANQSMNRNVNGGVVRFAYDPKTAQATLWLDSIQLGQFAVPSRVANGQHVMFNSHYPIKVESLTVLSGVVPPAESDAKQDAKSDQILLANGDRVSIKSVVLSEKEFLITTSFGPLRCPLGSVTAVDLNSKSLEEPRRKKDDVQVRAMGGRLTFELVKLTGEHLIGRHDYIGDIKLDRKEVQDLKLNLYR